MNNAAYDTGRLALMLNELRLPTIARLWPEFAQRSDKEGWQATRLLGALLEHELAERAKRRIERHRAESHLDPTKTLASFDFSMVPMVSKAHASWRSRPAIRGSRKAPLCSCSAHLALAKAILDRPSGTR